MGMIVNPFLVNVASGGPPAFVGGLATNAINGGGATVSLTSLTGGSDTAPQEGDLVIVVATTGSTASRTVSHSGGWSELPSCPITSTDSFQAVTRVWYKIMTSTPDTTFSTNGTGNVTDATGYVVHVWRNIDQTTPFDVSETTAVGGNSTNADPPSIEPVTAGAIILAIGGSAGGTINAHTGPSMGSGLDYFFSGWGADTQDGCSSIYAKTDWSSGPYNPPAFSGGGGTTSSAWVGISVALRPA